ncbi:MSCRAMM family protein [[Clostridium] innocuum]|uniref:MSCRAMM family protein n=1 Tax=Clostridium innocuum TaxID=1522 RepID=UPI0032593DCE
MKKRNKIVRIMTLLLLSLCCIKPIQAQEIELKPDPSVQEKGSIHVELEETKDRLSREGVELSLARVADIQDGSYVLDDLYRSAGVDMNDIKTAQGLQEAADTLRPLVKSSLQAKRTDAQGIVDFTDLKVGVYLLYVSDQAGYETIQPTLISVPMWDETAKQMNYHIEVFPKHAPLPALHVRKVDYYDHKSILKEAAFTLYSDAECTEAIKTEKTDPKDGIASFDGLLYQTVYIKETKAPAGYQLSKEVIKVTIDDAWVKGDDDLRTIVYADRPLPTSGGPDTGDHTNIVGWIFLIGISACATVFFLHRKHEAQ